jgi:hypothetical protein
MGVQILTIEKKKYRLIAEEEYLQLKEDLKDLRTILKRKPEKGIEARDFLPHLKKVRNGQKVHGNNKSHCSETNQKAPCCVS